MRLTLPALGLGLALVLATTSCSGDDTDPEAGGSPTPTPSSSPTPTSSPTTPEAECTVADVPSDQVVLESQRPAVIYVATHSLAPAGRFKEIRALALYDPTPVRVTSPSGRVPADVRSAVLDTVGKAWGKGGLPEESPVYRFSVRNPSAENATFVLYRGGYVARGTWTAQRCGAPYNDGKTVVKMAGKFSTVTRLTGPRVYRCGAEPAGEMQRAAVPACA